MKLRYKILLGILLTPLLAWSVFQANEYLTGNAYLPYLQENMENIKLDGSTSFELLEDDLKQVRFVMLGENHGFKIPQKVDPLLFGHLNTKHDFNYYLLEMDQSQAYFMNRYNETGNDSLLTEVLSQWVVSGGRENLDYKKRFQALRDHYQTTKKFQYIGNDKIAAVELVAAHLSEILPDVDIPYDPTRSDSLNLVHIGLKLENLLSDTINTELTETIKADLEYLLTNISYSLDKTYREEVLTLNLLDLYKRQMLKNEKIYAFFGLGHAFKAPAERGYSAMANRLIEKDSWFAEHMITMVFLYEDSKQFLRSRALPPILRDEGKYTKFSFSMDDLLLSYLYGIEDLKRVTRSNTTTLFKINGENTPYRNSNRLFQMTQLIPAGGLISAAPNRSTSEYFDYAIMVRDSEWAEPLPSVVLAINN